MVNLECCKVHDIWRLNFFGRMLLNGDPGGFEFSWGRLPEKEAQFFLGGCYLYRNYAMIVILLSFLCNYNLTLKLHQEKRSYPDGGWIFIDRFKVGSVPGMSVALEASKKVSKSFMSMIQGH